MDQFGKTLRELLDFDALDTAERIAGKSHTTDADTMQLGYALHVAKSRELKKRLKENMGTYMSQSVPDYIKVVEDIGFKQIYEEGFHSTSSNKDEKLFCFFLYDEAVLLKFDTYRGSINDGNFWYNWMPNSHKTLLMSSGEYIKVGDRYYHSGEADCREALRYHIDTLRHTGKFIKPWPRSPMGLWIHHHMESIEEGISKSRISKFPIEVQILMGIKSENIP